MDLNGGQTARGRTDPIVYCRNWTQEEIGEFLKKVREAIIDTLRVIMNLRDHLREWLVKNMT